MLAVLLAPVVLLAVLGRSNPDRTILLAGRPRSDAIGLAVVAGGTLALGVVGGYLSSSAFAGRYIAVIIPLVVLLLALGLSRVTAARTLAGVLLVLALVGLASIVDVATTDRSQADEWAAVIDGEAGPDDLVVFCPDQLGPAGTRALAGELDAVTYPELGDPEFVDWVDYAERNAAADPAAFVETVVDRAADGDIWLVWNGEYRTLEGQCEAVATELRAARPNAGPVVADNGADFFEHAQVIRFRAP